MNRDPLAVLEFPVPVMVFDENLDLVAASREAFTLFGQVPRQRTLDNSLAALQETFMADTGPGKDVTAVTLRMTRSGITEQLEWQTPSLRSIEVTVSLLDDGAGPMFTVLFRDRTAGNRLRTDLEAAREHLVEVINSLPLGIAVMDRSLRATHVNQTQLDFLRDTDPGLDLVSVTGQRLGSFMPDGGDVDWHRLENDFLESGDERKRFPFEIEIDGDTRFFSCVLVRLRNSRGDLDGNILICEDITERHRIETQLQQARLASAQMEALRAVDVTLRHEICNALTPISLNCEVMKELACEENRAPLDVVLKNVERIQTVLEKLGGMQRFETETYMEDMQMLDLDADVRAAPEPGCEGGPAG